jgi:RHS repeat-associated protein
MIRPSNRARIRNISDYSPFGVQLSERTISGDGYRYGFQGQEMDDELKGDGNSVNYKYRMHDPRLGRFFAIDPLSAEYLGNSPYAFSENVVINAVELEGLEKVYVYNRYTNDKGEEITVPSHTYIDKQLKVNLNQVNTYYGAKIPAEVTFKTFGKGLSISFEIKDGNDKNLKTNEAVRATFNPKPIIAEPVVESSSPNAKPYIDKMIDEAWNKGDYGRALSYMGNKSDQSWEGEKGLVKYSKCIDKVGTVLQYTPLAAVGVGLSAFSATIDTGLDFKNDNQNAWSNLGVRTLSTIATGKKIGAEKYINLLPIKDFNKQIIKGAVNQGAGLVSDENIKQ